MKHKWAHEWHTTCATSSARFKREQASRAVAITAGLPVIEAGVLLPSGRVFAWTSLANFEVEKSVYDAGLSTPDHVLDISSATIRHEPRPPEVYA